MRSDENQLGKGPDSYVCGHGFGNDIHRRLCDFARKTLGS